MKFKAFSSENYDLDKVQELLENGDIGYGRLVEEFERAFNSCVSKAKHCIATSSATAAADMIFAYYRRQGVFNVITPTLGFTSPAAMALKNGHNLVLADINPKTLSLDRISFLDAFELCNEALVMPILYGGNPLGNEIPAAVVDSAHSLINHGSSMFTFYSFYNTKPLAMINGGCIATNDDEAAEFLRCYRNFGRTPTTSSYEITMDGNKYYMDQVNAQLGLSNLRKISIQKKIRHANHNIYEGRLSKYGQFSVHSKYSSYYLCSFLLNNPIAAELIEYLKPLVNLPTHYPLLHKQPFYKNHPRVSVANIKYAENVYDRLVNLPIHHTLGVVEIETVCRQVEKFFEEAYPNYRKWH